MEVDVILQSFLITVIQVIVPVVLVALVALIKEQIGKVKANLDQDKMAFALDLINQFVLAAEQNGLKDEVFAEGKAKKAWVYAQVQQALAERGIKLDVTLLGNLIEAQVYAALNQFKE